jgi:hypothetical protein
MEEAGRARDQLEAAGDQIAAAILGWKEAWPHAAPPLRKRIVACFVEKVVIDLRTATADVSFFVVPEVTRAPARRCASQEPKFSGSGSGGACCPPGIPPRTGRRRAG